MRRLARPLLLSCAAAGTLAIGACGDAGNDGPEVAPGLPAARPVDTILASTFGPGAEGPDSGRLALRMTLSGAGSGALRGPLDVRVAGPFDLSRTDQVPRFDLSTMVRTGARTVRSRAVSTGERGFAHIRGRTYELAPALYRQIAEVLLGDAGEGGKLTLRSLRIDPRRWLLGARRGPDEQVAGVEAIHLIGRLNVPRLLDDLDTMLGQAGRAGLLTADEAPHGLGPEERERLVGEVAGSGADIWTGARDRILRRLDVRLGLRAGGGLRLQLSLHDVDGPQSIAAPRSARPFSELVPGNRTELIRSMSGP